MNFYTVLVSLKKDNSQDSRSSMAFCDLTWNLILLLLSNSVTKISSLRLSKILRRGAWTVPMKESFSSFVDALSHCAFSVESQNTFY